MNVVYVFRLHSPVKASNELRSITERFGEDQDYDRAYRQLINADCVALHVVSKSKQQMCGLKEHVTNSSFEIQQQGWANCSACMLHETSLRTLGGPHSTNQAACGH